MRWALIVFGAAFTLISTLFYRQRNSWNVHYEAGSPEFVTLCAVVSGLALFILGILSYLFPKVEEWTVVYSETADNASSVYDILVFLALQGLLVFGLFYTVIYKLIIKRENTDLLPGVLIFTAVSVIYWGVIFWSDSFDTVYKAPFQNLYRLIFG